MKNQTMLSIYSTFCLNPFFCTQQPWSFMQNHCRWTAVCLNICDEQNSDGSLKKEKNGINIFISWCGNNESTYCRSEGKRQNQLSKKKKTRKILYEIIFADVSISFLPELCSIKLRKGTKDVALTNQVFQGNTYKSKNQNLSTT